MVLFLNGIPVVSLELKCQFGQDTANAIQQYKFDRAGKDHHLLSSKPVLVQFAVDLTVYDHPFGGASETYFFSSLSTRAAMGPEWAGATPSIPDWL